MSEDDVKTDVFNAAVDELNYHNIDPDKFDLDRLITRHDFSQFVVQEDAGSSWEDIRKERQLRTAEEDAIIRQMFRQEIS